MQDAGMLRCSLSVVRQPGRQPWSLTTLQTVLMLQEKMEAELQKTRGMLAGSVAAVHER